MWRAFLVATRFLTRLPVPDPGSISGADLGRSVILYPLVGLVMGTLIWGMSILLVGFGAPEKGPTAILVLVLWVWLSGGLHLDGLADTADAWIGGLGSRERTLEIMKDPVAGPFGVTALVLILLCKLTGIAALIGTSAALYLIWIPVLARAQLLLLFLTTPYARSEGMGAWVGTELPRTAARICLGGLVAASVLLLGLTGFILVLAAGVLFTLWRRSMMARLDGYTGDTAGALVEMTEALMLLVAVFFL